MIFVHVLPLYTFTFYECIQSYLKVKVAQLCSTLCNPMDLTRQAPLSIPFSRDLPTSGIKPSLPTLQADSLLSEPLGKPHNLTEYIPICVYAYTYMYICIHIDCSHAFAYLFFNKLLLEQFWGVSKTKQKAQSSYISPDVHPTLTLIHTHISFPIISILHHRGMFVNNQWIYSNTSQSLKVHSLQSTSLLMLYILSVLTTM